MLAASLTLCILIIATRERSVNSLTGTNGSGNVMCRAGREELATCPGSSAILMLLLLLPLLLSLLLLLLPRLLS